MTNKYADPFGNLNPFPDWFEEVASASLTIDHSKKGLSHEAHENWWAFSISQHQANTIVAGDIVKFLSGVAQAREQQIRAHSGAVNPVVFYCWCDEQDSQLCFSLVSVSHNRIPFGAIVKETDDFAQVVKQFLSNQYHDGIPMEEFIMQEEYDELDRPEPPPYVVLVATKILPLN